MAIQYPKGYRYKSDMELFKKIVDCAEKMLKDRCLIILYYFIDTVDAEILIGRDEFEERYGEIDWDVFIKILNSEVLHILRMNFEEYEEGSTDKELILYLNSQQVPEEQQEQILELKSEKFQYVDSRLGGERERNRYRLKSQSFMKKLSDFDFVLSRTIDEEEIIYATVKMSVSSSFGKEDIPSKMRDALGSNENEESIMFLCDKSDIDYLIEKLQKIKQML